MTRQAIRGLTLLALTAALVASTARAQNTPDVVTVRDRKDNSTRPVTGQYTVSAAGFQVVGTDKKAVTVNPDDVVKVAIGDLVGVDRNKILELVAKEEKKDYEGARAGYQDALKKAMTAPDKTKRYLEYKTVANYHKVVDELDPDKGWKEKAEDVVKAWSAFLSEPANRTGWEAWPAVRASSRLQMELGKFDEAANTWGRIATNKDMPPDARLEAQLQQIDLQIRGGKQYGPATSAAGELLKTAAGPRKERLEIYELTAKAAESGKPLEGIDKVRAALGKATDPSVQATGYSMLAELYLAGGKPRDAMWAFLWVETVLNQDRDEAFKAVARLTGLFEGQLADEDQAKKYRDKLKRFRSTF